jgi:hypothetical protein
VSDAIAIVRRRLRHPDFHAALDAMGEETSLRADLRLCDLDLLTIQTDIDELAGFETPDGIYHKWERVADVAAALHRYTKEVA